MKKVILSELKEGMELAVISYWHFEEGDPVEQGDNLVEVTVHNEIHNVLCPCAGILNEIFFEEGDEVEEGEVLATIEEKSENNYGFEYDEGVPTTKYKDERIAG